MPKRKANSIPGAEVPSSEGAEVEGKHLLKKSMTYFASLSHEELLRSVSNIITYARTLKPAPPVKSPEAVAAEVQKLRAAILKHIYSNMTYKNCGTGEAKWTYQGACPDPVVFQSLLDDPGKFKMKKLPLSKFYDCLQTQGVTVPLRYGAYLRFKGEHITVRRDATTGVFSFTGTYGFLKHLPQDSLVPAPTAQQPRDENRQLPAPDQLTASV